MGSDGIFPPLGVLDEADLIQGGTRELDGDKVAIDFVPSTYTRNITPAEVDDVRQVTAHLKGIDLQLSATSDTIFAVVRNETGAPLTVGTLVRVIGFSGPEVLPLVDDADKDTVNGEALGVLQATIANNANGNAVAFGPVGGLDTSTFSLGQELILDNAGAFVARPAKGGAHTGLFQPVGVISRVDGSVGVVLFRIASPDAVSGGEYDALAGSGTPSTANPYVTADDGRLPTQGENDALVGTQGAPSSGNKYVTNLDPRLAPILSATATLDDTTVSPTDVMIAGMQITLGAGEDGDYLIEFSSSVENTNNGNTQEVVLYAGAGPTIVAESERRIENGAGQASPVHCSALVTGLSEADTIEAHWRTSGNTATMHERVLVARRVS